MLCAHQGPDHNCSHRREHAERTKEVEAYKCGTDSNCQDARKVISCKESCERRKDRGVGNNTRRIAIAMTWMPRNARQKYAGNNTRQGASTKTLDAAMPITQHRRGVQHGQYAQVRDRQTRKPPPELEATHTTTRSKATLSCRGAGVWLTTHHLAATQSNA